MTGRMDELLAEALATGRMPNDATAAEREELTVLLEASRLLMAEAPAVREEASSSLPAARARFERFLDQEQATPQSARREPRGGLPDWLGSVRGPVRTFAAAAAAVTIVVVGLIIAALLDNGDTARADVLVPGEYVQFEAVAGETTADGFAAGADFGDVQVVLDDETELVDDVGSPSSEVRPGRVVVVGGVVGEDRRVRARTVAVSESDWARPDEKPPKRLEQFRELGGRVVAFALGDDGQPRVVILAGDELVVVRVDADSLEALLGQAETAVGATVDVVRHDASDRRVFGLEHRGGGPGGPLPGGDRPRPQLPLVSGIATSLDGAILAIRVPGGTREVQLTTRTSFRVYDPIFDFDDQDPSQLIGRNVTAWVLRPADGSGVAVADVVAIGRAAE